MAVLTIAPLGALAHADVGTLVEDVELATPGGARLHLLDGAAKVTVLVFVRTAQERSADALKAMAQCEKELGGRPVRFVALVSGDTPPAEVQALAAASGMRMPILLDAKDALYEKLGVRLHPVVFLLDAAHKVASFEQYRQIDYCAVIQARIKFLLGEIDQAKLDRIVEPPRNTMPGDDPRAVSNRDLNLGRLLFGKKQYELALKSARKALERAPSAGAFALIGDVQAVQGRCDQALKSYQQALKLDPAEAHALAGQKTCQVGK